jgi:hypothetical protein
MSDSGCGPWELPEDGVAGGIVIGPDGVQILGTLPPHLVAVTDQIGAAVAQKRIDGPVARREGRCVAAPLGCGQPLGKPLAVAFRDQRSRSEYEIVGLCQTCQDEVYRVEPQELLEMAADTANHDRCPVCGEWRALEHVDVGVGTISGFDCCPTDVRYPRCERTEGCSLAADHQYNCDPSPYDVEAGWQRLKAWLVEQGLIEPEGTDG